MTGCSRVAGPEEAELVASIHASGFALDPVMSWVFSEPERDSKLAAVWGFLCREALVPMGHTYLLGDSCAAWTPPGAPPWPAERSERFRAQLDAACLPDDVRRLGALDDVLAAHHPREPVWYLGSMATAPHAQGLGLGDRLLTDTLAVVDQSGLPAFLEATSARSARLYERHGFRPLEHVDLPAGPTLITMWRDPNRRNATS